MKKLLSSILYLLCPCFAFAQVTIQQDPSTPVPAALLAGSTFSINLELNNQTTSNIAGYDVDVESFAYNLVSNTYVPVSNDFDLTGVTLTNAALNFANETSPTASSPLLLAPQAGPSTQPFDLGASNIISNQTVGQGISELETLSFKVTNNSLPGLYKLEFFSIVGNKQGPPTIADDNFNSVGTATSPFFSNSFTVVGVPEPSSTWLFGVAGVCALLVPRTARRLKDFIKKS